MSNFKIRQISWQAIDLFYSRVPLYQFNCSPLWVLYDNPQPPGLHQLAFNAENREQVDKLYQLVLDVGGTILHIPAQYNHYALGYYAFDFADPNGIKLKFVHMPNLLQTPMENYSEKPSIDFDRGAIDGNYGIPPVEPDNSEYIQGYEHGLRLADIAVPYLSSYPEQPKKKKKKR